MLKIRQAHAKISYTLSGSGLREKAGKLAGETALFAAVCRLAGSLVRFPSTLRTPLAHRNSLPHLRPDPCLAGCAAVGFWHRPAAVSHVLERSGFGAVFVV